MDTLKFKLVVAFDGTNYAGWQVQQSGVGVQQRVEEALAKLFPGIGRIHSSSRTDAGVHALGMVAHFELPRALFKMQPAKLALAINAHLPEDIRIASAQRCPADFHARFDASGKKTENAKFLRVLYNGLSVQNNVECDGPTRAGMNHPEAATNTIMLQGDHGPVAFRNIYVHALRPIIER